MERVSKLTALVCGILFIALSICHSYILVVQTDDFIYRRETGQLVEGQEAQCWSATDRRTGERHQFLFPGPGRLVFRAPNIPIRSAARCRSLSSHCILPPIFLIPSFIVREIGLPVESFR